MSDSQCHRARPAPQVEHALDRVRCEPGEREFDQELGLGSGNEHVRRDLEIEPEEFAMPGEIGDRLAVVTPPRQSVERMRLLARQRGFTMRGEPGAIAIQNVSEQKLGFERIEPAHGERRGNRRRQIHRVFVCRRTIASRGK